MVQRVGFVGVGNMGLPMVERIAGAGFDVAAVVRRPEVAARVATMGIEIVADVTALASHRDVLVICTFSDAQLRDVVFGATPGRGALAALRPGAVLVNHVTGSPALAIEMSAAAASVGAYVVDAPVSGSAEQIRAGMLTVLAGADAQILDRVRPVIASYASTILHVGGVGDGQRVKLVNNLVFAVHLRVAAHAAEVARSLGLDEVELGKALVHCSATSLPISLLERAPAQDLVAAALPFLSKPDLRH